MLDLGDAYYLLGAPNVPEVSGIVLVRYAQSVLLTTVVGCCSMSWLAVLPRLASLRQAACWLR